MIRTILIAVLAVVLTASQSLAAGSGAYRLEVPDSEAMGKGSAFVGEADNPSAVYYNPAGLTQLKGKNHVELGYAVIQPNIDYTDTSGLETQMRRQTFIIPHFYFVSDFGLDKVAFGLGATSSWGLGTYWAEDSFSRYVSTKADLFNKDTMLTMGYQVSDQLSLGVALDYDYSNANKKKRLIQLGGADGDFQLKGKDDGWGYRLSGRYELTEQHHFGLQYRSAIKEKYRGKIYLDDLNSAGSNYAAIFGGSSYETEISSENTLPQSVVFGYSYLPNEKWTFNTDIEWMDWSSVEQEKIVYEFEQDPTRLAVLNAGNPIDRDWHSTISVSTGVEYKATDRLRLRTGYYYHQTPIPEATLDTSLPDSDSHSITFGAGYDISKDLTVDVAYSAMFFNDRKVDNTVGNSSGSSIDGRYEQFTNIWMMSLAYQF